MNLKFNPVQFFQNGNGYRLIILEFSGRGLSRQCRWFNVDYAIKMASGMASYRLLRLKLPTSISISAPIYSHRPYERVCSYIGFSLVLILLIPSHSCFTNHVQPSPSLPLCLQHVLPSSIQNASQHHSLSVIHSPFFPVSLSEFISESLIRLFSVEKSYYHHRRFFSSLNVRKALQCV